MLADVDAFDIRHGFRVLLDIYPFALSLLLAQDSLGAAAIRHQCAPQRAM